MITLGKSSPIRFSNTGCPLRHHAPTHNSYYKHAMWHSIASHHTFLAPDTALTACLRQIAPHRSPTHIRAVYMQAAGKTNLGIHIHKHIIWSHLSYLGKCCPSQKYIGNSFFPTPIMTTSHETFSSSKEQSSTSQVFRTTTLITFPKPRCPIKLETMAISGSL